MTFSELKEQLRQCDLQLEKQAAQLERQATTVPARHEQKQRSKRRRKKSTGRKPKDAKRDFATETIDLYWHGANRKKCVLRREQFVWLVEVKSCSQIFWENTLAGLA